MTNPRDPVPANRSNQQQLSERQEHHLDAITTAGDGLYAAMHAAEGSNPPGQYEEQIFLSKRMNEAATLLELALMMARKAALETR